MVRGRRHPWPYDPVANTITEDPRYATGHLHRTLSTIGLGDHWACRPLYRGGEECYGLPFAGLRALYRRSCALGSDPGASGRRRRGARTTSSGARRLTAAENRGILKAPSIMDSPYTAPELSVVVPTLNEVGNVRRLVEGLEAALRGFAWEVIFVDDDSTDGTIEALRELTRTDPRVRIVHRIGRRGLASAVVEGILSTSSPYIAVMDADLQHDETILPRMFEALKTGEVDVVVGSRYTEGGGIGDWDRKRAFASRVATRLAKLVLRADLSDPMSGYFAVTRATFDSAVRRLSSQGYKILFDLFASLRTPPRFVEIPYTFRTRHRGVSKVDALVTWESMMLILDKLFGQVIPVRFFMFGLVGGLGVIVHFLSLWLLHRVGHMGFPSAQTFATMVAMTFNFFLNNVLTYRDRRVRGWRLLVGLLSFYAVCSVGVVANVGVGSFLFGQRYAWWIAGAAGAVVGAVWNYAATSVFTWRGKR